MIETYSLLAEKLLFEKVKDIRIILKYKQYFDKALSYDVNKLYGEISFVCGIITSPFIFAKCFWFSDIKNVEKGLKSYNHTPDYLRWLLDRMTEQDFREGIVLVEHRLAEIGALGEDSRERFDL